VSKVDAQEIASKWQYGRGSELTYYDIDTFRLIFGVEAGTLLYGYARKELRTSKTAPNGGLRQQGKVERPKKDIFGMEPGCKFVQGSIKRS
jgi:hypothetical protein